MPLKENLVRSQFLIAPKLVVFETLFDRHTLKFNCVLVFKYIAAFDNFECTNYAKVSL